MTELDQLLKEFKKKLKKLKEKHESDDKNKRLIEKIDEIFYRISVPLNQKTRKFVEIFQDISEKKQAEEKLKESKEMYRIIYENINDLIVIVESQDYFKFEYINEQAYLNLLGYTNEKLIGKSILDYIHPDDVRTVVTILKKGSKIRNLSQELRIKDKNGQFNWFEFKVKKFKVDNFQKKLLLILRNISKQKNLENEIKEKEERIKKLTSSIPEIRFWKLFSPKKYEEALRISHDMLQMVIENIPESIFWKDSNLVYTGCNKNYVKLIGAERQEDIIDKTDNELLLNKQKAKVVREHETFTIKSDIAVYHNIESWVLKNGTQIWLDTNRIPLHDSEGKIMGILVTYEDITEKTLAEQKLKESEEKYRLITEKASDLIAVLNKNFEYEYINEQVHKKLMGYSKEDVIGKSSLDFIHSDDIEEAVKELKKGFKKGEGVGEVRTRNKKGDYIWLEIRGKSFIDKDGQKKALLISRDITERKKAEQKLKESEHNLKERVKELSCLYGISQLLERSDISVEELLKRTLDLIPLSMQFPEIICARIIFENKDYKTENYRETDWKLPIEIRINEKLLKLEVFFLEDKPFLKEENDLINEIVKRLKVIIERKKAEALRERFTEKLEKKVKIRTKELNEALVQQKLYQEQILKSSQFKSEFLASMSHELRTPLNSVIGFTDILLEGFYGEINKKQEHYLNNVRISAIYLLDLINEILDISKIEAGKLELNIEEVQLSNIVNQVDATIKPMYEEKKLKFEVIGQDEEKFIQVDPIRFKEILYNLLSNAIKYTKEGGIKFKISEHEDNWEFNVIDTGIGIAEEDFDLIFKEFTRGKSDYVLSIEGSGLGLLLTKKLIELHGGNITFTSELGKGTTFTLILSKNINK